MDSEKEVSVKILRLENALFLSSRNLYFKLSSSDLTWFYVYFYFSCIFSPITRRMNTVEHSKE